MEQEFTDLIAENQGIILKVCRMYCPTTEDAEDLFQEIVLQMWRAFPRFHHSAKVTTWMYRIALNTATTRLRKRRGKIVYQRFSSSAHDCPDNGTDGKVTEKEEALWRAINQLNKFDKALVVLYLEDKSYQEMSDIMGISETYVGVKLNRIKKKLKELLTS